MTRMGIGKQRQITIYSWWTGWRGFRSTKTGISTFLGRAMLAIMSLNLLTLFSIITSRQTRQSSTSKESWYVLSSSPSSSSPFFYNPWINLVILLMVKLSVNLWLMISLLNRGILVLAVSVTISFDSWWSCHYILSVYKDFILLLDRTSYSKLSLWALHCVGGETLWNVDNSYEDRAELSLVGFADNNYFKVHLRHYY